MPMTLTGTVQLNACGCKLTVEYTSPRKGREALHLAQRRIKAMLKEADEHHDCRRAWNGNPNGDTRLPDRPNREAVDATLTNAHPEDNRP